tara:strand:+ start:165 stop:350 length:186 start_codon:yes stop_codon:yes gene_type:complete
VPISIVLIGSYRRCEGVWSTGTFRDEVAISGHRFLAAAGQVPLSAHTVDWQTLVPPVRRCP